MELAKILRSFGISNAKIRPIATGMINKSYLIKTKDSFVLREIDNPGPKKLDFEIRFMKYLENLKSNIPKIFPSRNGNYYVKEGKVYLLQEFIQGERPKYDNEEIVLIASELAKMHLSSELFPIGELPTFRAEDLFSFGFDKRVEVKYYPQFLKKHPELEKKLNKMVDIRRKIEKKMISKKNKLPEGIIHNDPSNENVIISKNQAYFIDFDFLCKGKFVSDIGSASYYCVLNNIKKKKQNKKRFIKSYNDVRKIDPNEKAIIQNTIIHQHIINTNFLIRKVQNSDGDVKFDSVRNNLEMLKRLIDD